MFYIPYTNHLWYGCEKSNLPTLEKPAKRLKIIKNLKFNEKTLQPTYLLKHQVYFTTCLQAENFCSDVCLRIMLNCTLFLPGIPVVGSMEKYGWPCRKLYRRRALLPLEGSSASLAVTWMTNVPEEKIHSYKKLSLWSF